MKKLYSNNINNIHLIGIGGSSMVAVAEILHHQGYTITGSDIAENGNTLMLKKKGIKIYKGHGKENINNADLIIHTSAVHDDNPEIIEAKKKGITILKRNEFFKKLTREYTNSVAITGAHGKTTVTSMIAVMLKETDIDPTLIVGARVEELGGNVYIGKSDFIVNEACEFEASFLDFYHSIGIILNIDNDHLDYYKNMDNLKKAFVKFANDTTLDGKVIMNIDDENTRSIMKHIERDIITFSVERDADFTAKNKTINKKGFPEFDVYRNDELLGHVSLSVRGEYNITNSLAAISCVSQYTDNIKPLLKGLKNFKGAQRRFEFHGELNGALLFDDFAHHPNEIRSVLKAARAAFPEKRIVVGFQPHTYSRTKLLFEDFLNCFKDSDYMYVMDIFAAREELDPTIHSLDIVNKSKTPPAEYTKTFEDLRDAMYRDLKEGDVFFSIGCGDVYRIFSFLKMGKKVIV